MDETNAELAVETVAVLDTIGTGAAENADTDWRFSVDVSERFGLGPDGKRNKPGRHLSGCPCDKCAAGNASASLADAAPAQTAEPTKKPEKKKLSERMKRPFADRVRADTTSLVITLAGISNTVRLYRNRKPASCEQIETAAAMAAQITARYGLPLDEVSALISVGSLLVGGEEIRGKTDAETQENYRVAVMTLESQEKMIARRLGIED